MDPGAVLPETGEGRTPTCTGMFVTAKGALSLSLTPVHPPNITLNEAHSFLSWSTFHTPGSSSVKTWMNEQTLAPGKTPGESLL